MAKMLREAYRGLDTLPDELLIRVISLLPFIDAVRTSILSMRWRYLYASVSNLHFNFKQDGNRRNLTGFQNVVDKLFDLRSSSRCLVDKFSLSDSVSRDLNPLHVQRWMQSVTWHGVRKLDLIIPSAVMVPSSLCTCKTLEVLRLEMTSRAEVVYDLSKYPLFQVPTKICLPSLKVLHLMEVAYTDDECANRLISNCPVLEELVLHFPYYYDCKLSVSNTTLKFLAIEFLHSVPWTGSSFDTVINAPNIEFLRYSSSSTTPQTFLFGPALTSVTFDMKVFPMGPSLYVRLATDLLRSIKDIETLCIACHVLHCLEDFNIPLPVFKNLRHLAIDICEFGLRPFPNLLPHCASLEHIEFMDGCRWNPRPEELIPLEEPGVGCLTTHLKTVEFFEFKPEENQIEAVKYFLKTASVLKTVEIHLSGDVDANSEIVKELPRLPRISEECNVVICQKKLSWSQKRRPSIRY